MIRRISSTGKTWVEVRRENVFIASQYSAFRILVDILAALDDKT